MDCFRPIIAMHTFAMLVFDQRQACLLCLAVSVQHQCNISAALVRTASVHRVVLSNSIKCRAPCLAACHAMMCSNRLCRVSSAIKIAFVHHLRRCVAATSFESITYGHHLPSIDAEKQGGL